MHFEHNIIFRKLEFFYFRSQTKRCGVLVQFSQLETALSKTVRNTSRRTFRNPVILIVLQHRPIPCQQRGPCSYSSRPYVSFRFTSVFLFPYKFKYITENHCQQDTGSNLGPRPDIQTGLSWFSSVPQVKCLEDTILNQEMTASFLILTNYLVINHLIAGCYVF